MTTQYLILYIIMNTGLCLAQCLFSFSLLTPKWKKLPTFLVFFVPYTAAALSQKIFTDINPTLLIILTFGIFIITSVVLFKDKIGFKVLVLCLNLFINIAFFGIILSALFEITGIDPNSVSVLNFGVNGIVFLTDFIVAWFIKNRKKEVELDGKSIAVFAALTITQFITYFILMVIINSDVIYEQNKHFSLVGDTYVDMTYFIYILLVVFVVADVLVFRLLKKSYTARKTEEQLALAEYKNEINLDYYKQLEQNQLETRKLYHDMSNIVEVCKALADDEHTKGNATEILAEVEKTLSKIKTVCYCQNNLVNTVLTTKINLCKEKDIAVTTDINLPAQIKISEADLCRSLVNLFDNAIEAAQKCEAPYVKFSAGIDNGHLFIGTQNPVPPEKSIKKTEKNHGFGLKILSDVAEKYNGELTTATADGSIRKMLVLKLDG